MRRRIRQPLYRPLPRPGITIILVLAAVVLTGCQNTNPIDLGVATGASEPVHDSSPPAEMVRVPDGLLEFVATARPGQYRIVQDPTVGPSRVMMGREYFSAAGLTCRRFTTEGGGRAPVTRAACRDSAGWHLDPIAVGPEVPPAR